MRCVAIGWYDVFIDVFVPLLSALVGGLITMLGVVYTIKHEQKKSAEQARESVKPWIFSVDTTETGDGKNVNTYSMQAEEVLSYNRGIDLLIKNTDNGIAILERFQTKNNTYLPVYGRILDKNSITHLEICIAPNETMEEMYLYIKDIYGNEYRYRIDADQSPQKSYVLTEMPFYNA